MPFSDIVAVSGLLLTLTTFMFNLAWPRLHEALEMDEKQSGPQARKRSREKVFDALLGCALPLTSAFMALCYANLLAAVCLLVFALLNGWLAVRLVDKWRKLLAVHPFSYFSIYQFSTIVEIIVLGENSRQFSPQWLFSAFVEKGQINERARNTLKRSAAQPPEQGTDPRD